MRGLVLVVLVAVLLAIELGLFITGLVVGSVGRYHLAGAYFFASAAIGAVGWWVSRR